MSPDPVLIATKLRPPMARRRVVERPELIERLAATDVRLVLVCAPAGWGKTTLAASWCERAAGDRALAWLSLDLDDDEPVRFWAHVLEALGRAVPELDHRPTAIVRAPGTRFARDVLPVLVNGLEATGRRIALVLDDLHLVRDPAIHDGLMALIDRAPAGLRLVLVTRADPPLPLGRLRAAGDLLELRAADLGLSDDETERLLSRSLGMGVSPDQARVLRERTEGWAAGVCLAALGAQGQPDPGAFLADLAGDDRNIVDYLCGEVLDRQEPELRDFLLDTSVLERLSAPLCEAVTGRAGAARMLAALEAGNAFIAALDSRRAWFRYHHLFRDLLRHERELRRPGRAPELHRRAADWFRADGRPLEAVNHALAAEDAAGAAELVAEHWYPAAMAGEYGLVERWLAALPAATVEGDARLAFAQAMVHLYRGRLDAAERWAAIVEAAPAGGPFHDGLDSGAAGAACVRGIAAWQRGDLGRAAAASWRLQELTAPDSPWHVGDGPVTMGRHWRGAPLRRTLDDLASHEERGRLSGHTSVEIWAASHAALVLAEAGDARAGAAADRALAVARRYNDEFWVSSVAHVARAMALTASGRADEAVAAAERALDLTRRDGGRLEQVLAQLALAAALRSVDRPRARAAVRGARLILAECPDPGLLPTRVAAVEARLGPATLAEAPAALSPRELEVLRLLAGERSQREIAASLHVSVNTLKTHLRQVFRKLGASSREEAVARARAAGLLEPRDGRPTGVSSKARRAPPPGLSSDEGSADCGSGTGASSTGSMSPPGL